jgi:thiosulfate dehydrogenase
MAKRFLFFISVLFMAMATNAQKRKSTVSATARQMAFGKDLIARTAFYFGPKGKVGHIANGMNCQNCHNDAGTKFYALNLISTAANYPQYMPRTGDVMSIAGRINGCMERSMNGRALDTTSREIKAMVAYIKSLGKDVAKGQRPAGSSVLKLAYMDKPADPLKGKAVFVQKCQACHGAKGQGLKVANSAVYTYPPLWGKDSYNDGAGLYRITTFAAFVKSNMPFGTTYKNPQLTDEEAWNVAAFINSQPRPHFDQHNDWKDISRKPIDFPFGPYADQFGASQHKFGPYQPIADVQKSTTKKS